MSLRDVRDLEVWETGVLLEVMQEARTGEPTVSFDDDPQAAEAIWKDL